VATTVLTPGRAKDSSNARWLFGLGVFLLALCPPLYASVHCAAWRFVNPASSPEVNLEGVASTRSHFPKGSSLALVDAGNPRLEYARVRFEADARVGGPVRATLSLKATDSEAREVPVSGRWVALHRTESVMWLMNPVNGWFLTIRSKPCGPGRAGQ
jgi:hypothetical protein